MPATSHIVVFLGLAAALAPSESARDGSRPSAASPKLDVPYEPTHPQVVEAMLELAGVTNEDILVDLGCGDGRIPIAAAKKFGARAVGVDLDPQRIQESNDNAAHEGVRDLVEFKRQNAAEADLRSASVVTMYLLNRVNLSLRPKLLRELPAGARVVSHAFHMADWEPDRMVRHPKARGGLLYFWTIPAGVGGTWNWNTGNADCRLDITQQFQAASGRLQCDGMTGAVPAHIQISGANILISASADGEGPRGGVSLRGVVKGDGIAGTQHWSVGPDQGTRPWTAVRAPTELRGCWVLRASTRDIPDGTLCLQQRNRTLEAELKRHGKPVEAAFYSWGTSIEVDTLDPDGTPLVFEGVLGAEGGQGILRRTEGLPDLTWTARRVNSEHTDGLPERETPPEKVNNVDGSVLVWVPGGLFRMGSDNGGASEQPAHDVMVAGFWLGKFEVTNQQYGKFLAARPDTPKPMYWDDPKFAQPDQPVIGVTWKEAAAYCEWAGLRLPTEAEWEYAAAAGRQFRFPTESGVSGDGLANVRGVSQNDRWEFTAPVGSFPPNPLGFFDMAGNAWEWTSSTFADYPWVDNDGRERNDSGSLKVLRGGAWYFAAEYSRTTARHRFASHLRYDYAGIRVALDGDPADRNAR